MEDLRPTEVLCIHQPSYFPWLGLVDKIAKSDTLIVLDEVKLDDEGFQHRNKFAITQGAEKYLTVGIRKKGHSTKVLRELEINPNVAWQKDHQNFLYENYRKYPFYVPIFDSIQSIFQKEYGLLVDVLMDSMRIVLDLLEIPTKIVMQSELHYDRNARKNELVLNLTQVSGAKVYLSGVGAKSYLNPSIFEAVGVRVDFQSYTHPVYPQQHKGPFLPGLAALDALFNLGAATTRNLVLSGLLSSETSGCNR